MRHEPSPTLVSSVGASSLGASSPGVSSVGASSADAQRDGGLKGTAPLNGLTAPLRRRVVRGDGSRGERARSPAARQGSRKGSKRVAARQERMALLLLLLHYSSTTIASLPLLPLLLLLLLPYPQTFVQLPHLAHSEKQSATRTVL